MAIWISKFLGPIILLLGVRMIVAPAWLQDTTKRFLDDPPLVLISGILAMTAGLSIVNTHNVWGRGWPVIITLFGWALLLGGAIRVAAPGIVDRVGGTMMGPAADDESRGSLLGRARGFPDPEGVRLGGRPGRAFEPAPCRACSRLTSLRPSVLPSRIAGRQASSESGWSWLPSKLWSSKTGTLVSVSSSAGSTSTESSASSCVGSFLLTVRGPPLHVHLAEHEAGTVHRGVLTAVVDGERVQAGPGEAAELPLGSAHRWWNEGDEPLEFTGYAKPLVDLDRYLQAVFEVVNAGPADRPPLVYLAHAMLRHRKTQVVLVMPRAIQAVVFRLAYLFGLLAGRYRGKDWPGCPARCTGAPSSGTEGAR